LPIAVVVEAHGRTVVEPIPVLADLDGLHRAFVSVSLDDLQRDPSMDRRSEGLGQQVVYGPIHDPFKSLPQPIYDAIGRVLDAPENVAALKASLDQAWYEMHEYVVEFDRGPRIRVLPGPPQQGREKAGKAMRDIRRMGKVDRITDQSQTLDFVLCDISFRRQGPQVLAFCQTSKTLNI
jgi:hypothetical protein